MALVLLFVGCAHGNTSFPFNGTSLVPAAEGKVSLSGKNQTNKTLEITVHHLAKPQDLNAREVMPGNKEGTTPITYVVWLQPLGGGAPENIGVLTPDQNLDAHLTTTTSQRRFDLFVTAEAATTQTAPTGQRLLQTTVQE